MAMTITPEELNAAIQEFDSSSHCRYDRFRTFAERVGITLAPAEPPEAMVKLAEDFARKAFMSAQGDPGRAAKIASLLTLQHVVGVVKGDGDPSARWAIKADILHKLGAGGRDAG